MTCCMKCMLVGCLVGWLFNERHVNTERSLCANCGCGNRLSRLRMTNEIQCILPYDAQQQCITVHSKTLQLRKRSNRLSIWSNDLLAYYYVFSAFANTKPDPTHHIRYNFTRCRCSFMSWPGFNQRKTGFLPDFQLYSLKFFIICIMPIYDLKSHLTTRLFQIVFNVSRLFYFNYSWH